MPAVRIRWVIVGAGRCGMQLARAMVAAKIPLAGVLVRSARGRARVRRLLPGVAAVTPVAAIPPADAVLIAVQDDVLADCARELAVRLPRGVAAALHTAGLRPGAVLAPLRERGLAVGSLHPLVMFPAPGGPPAALGFALAAVEGDEKAVRAGLALARALGMIARRIGAAHKPRYHAAAVLAANLTHVLVAEGRRLLQSTGFSRREAASALAPLVSASLAGALASEALETLTGPLQRGDAGTIAAHLRELDEPAGAAYRAVAALAVARLRSRMAANPSLDRVLRALTANHACDSVPADGRN